MQRLLRHGGSGSLRAIDTQRWRVLLSSTKTEARLTAFMLCGAHSKHTISGFGTPRQCSTLRDKFIGGTLWLMTPCTWLVILWLSTSTATFRCIFRISRHWQAWIGVSGFRRLREVSLLWCITSTIIWTRYLSSMASDVFWHLKNRILTSTMMVKSKEMVLDQTSFQNLTEKF